MPAISSSLNTTYTKEDVIRPLYFEAIKKEIKYYYIIDKYIFKACREMHNFWLTKINRLLTI